MQNSKLSMVTAPTIPGTPQEIEATPVQQILLEADEREQLFGGAKRGGKTVGTAMKAILLLTGFPGNRGVVFRQSLPDLRDTWLVEFFRICPPELILDHNKNERKITIKTGGAPSELLYMGAGDVVARKAAEKRKGLNVGFAIFEEATEIAEALYNMVMAQLTWVLPDGTRPPYMGICTSNPEPGWVKRRFLGDIASGTPPLPGTRFIPALPRDNAANLPPGWELELRATRDDEWVRKYLDGDWELSEGMVFDEINPRVHFLEHDVDVKGMHLLESLDHASTGVTCWLGVTQDRDGNLFFVDEYYERNKVVSEHAAAIQAKRHALLIRAFGEEPHQYQRREGGPPSARFKLSLIDPSTLALNQHTEKGLRSIAQMYQECGLNFIGAMNAIEVGIERLKEYIHVNPFHRHPFTQELAAPMLYIVRRRCPNLCRELIELRKEVTPAGQVMYIGTDHAVDNARYIVNAQPRPPVRTAGDLAALKPQEQFAHRAHERWAKEFGKPKAPNRWFGGKS